MIEESCLKMFELMTIIVQTRMIMHTKGFANVMKKGDFCGDGKSVFCTCSSFPGLMDAPGHPECVLLMNLGDP